MKVNVGIWGTLTRVVVFLFILAILLIIGEWYLPLIRQNERMRKEILRLDTKLEKGEKDRREMKTSQETLQNNPKAVERLARERLGYARPGETVIRFEPSTTNQVVR